MSLSWKPSTGKPLPGDDHRRVWRMTIFNRLKEIGVDYTQATGLPTPAPADLLQATESIESKKSKTGLENSAGKVYIE